MARGIARNVNAGKVCSRVTVLMTLPLWGSNVQPSLTARSECCRWPELKNIARRFSLLPL